jgi:alpha-ketoglutarate-dependent taurine dioxygenase
VNKGFTKRINGVTKDESDILLQYLFNVRSRALWQRDTNTNCVTQLVTQNHDAQVRYKWNKNDVAIWDNRSNWHCATYDYDESRIGDRVCSLGEAPYLDLSSQSRGQALAETAL